MPAAAVHCPVAVVELNRRAFLTTAEMTKVYICGAAAAAEAEAAHRCDDASPLPPSLPPSLKRSLTRALRS